MNHIVLHCPDDGLDKFEEISFLLKIQREGKLGSLSEFLKISEERAYNRPGKESHADLTAKFLQKVKKYFDVRIFLIHLHCFIFDTVKPPFLFVQKKGGEAVGEGSEATQEDAPADGGAQAGPCGYVPNLLADTHIYQWAGVGFGDNETLLL